jgi:hypothetical protein
MKTTNELFVELQALGAGEFECLNGWMHICSQILARRLGDYAN